MPGLQLPQRLKDFLDHWKSLRTDHQAPTLAAFFDRPAPALQPWIAIFDVDEVVPVRLFGTGLVSFYGADFTGRPFHEIVEPKDVDRMKINHRDIAQTCRGSLTVTVCTTTSGRSAELLSLGLPLRRHDAMSVAWVVEPGLTLSFGETGILLTRLASQTWLDVSAEVRT